MSAVKDRVARMISRLRCRAPRRVPDPGGLWFIAIALAAAAVVAGVAFSGSWQHQYELSVRLGQARWVAGIQPLSVEGLIAGATLVIWYAARYRCGFPWGAYLVLAAGIGQSVLMNLGADHPLGWLGTEISVWPAVAFAAGYEMSVWMMRKRHDARQAEAGQAKRQRERKPTADAVPVPADAAPRPVLALAPDAAPDEQARRAWLESGRKLSDRKLAEMFGRSRMYWTPRIEEWREATA